MPRSIPEHQIKEAEKAIYEELCELEPDMDDGNRKHLARVAAEQAAGIHLTDLATGDPTLIYCTCGCPDSAHVVKFGPCKTPKCGCPQFQADHLKFTPKQ